MRGPVDINNALAVQKFPTRKEAQDFANGGGNQPPPTNGPRKYYAVAVGNKPGIYASWGEAQPCIRGAPGAKQKKFNTQEEAEEFIRENGTPETCQALGIALSQAQHVQHKQEKQLEHPEQPARRTRQMQEYTGAAFEPVETPAKTLKSEPTTKSVSVQPAAESSRDSIRIYTDGSSRGNGQVGSRAGLGVFFGHDDERNHYERLPGMPQTNQRAELLAMLRAMEIVPLTQSIQIWSDSQYSINCATTWGDKWERSSWKNSQGKDVMNQDIIRDIRAKIQERKAAGARTELQWVKGHSSDPGNNAADRLANLGAELPAVD